MKTKSILFRAVALTLALMVLLGMAGSVFAAPPHPSAGSFVNAGDVPAGSKLILNITYKVTNDEDSGNVGYWALDNYNKTVKVWQVPDGSFYVVAGYSGKWQTFAGAKSPGAGIVQGADASGTWEGGYTGTFTGTFSPGDLKTNGNIGSKDLGGTQSDVLLGTYGAGQTGPTTPYSVLSAYFPGYSGFDYGNWGWTYHYKGQTWNNFDYGTTGDIVVP